MRILACVLSILSCSFPVAAQHQESVQDIVAKLAANQDRSRELRSAFVYHQTLVLRFRRGDGKLAREELREYTVTPNASGTNKTMIRFIGKYEKDGKLFEYNEPGYTYKDLDIDGELIDDFAEDLANEKDSRDGIPTNLFPLTSEQQKRYVFAIKGKEDYRGKAVYRISFKPAKPEKDDPEGGIPWAGEILVDAQEYQPVLVTTHLARGVPLVVRTLLGTNFKQLGFKIAYQQFEDGIWFPVNYGCEFELKAVFFYKRKIALALSNTGILRAQVATRISFEKPLTIDDRFLRLRELAPQPDSFRPVP